jgi:hypothetical protein
MTRGVVPRTSPSRNVAREPALLAGIPEQHFGKLRASFAIHLLQREADSRRAQATSAAPTSRRPRTYIDVMRDQLERSHHARVPATNATVGCHARTPSLARAGRARVVSRLAGAREGDARADLAARREVVRGQRMANAAPVLRARSRAIPGRR